MDPIDEIQYVVLNLEDPGRKVRMGRNLPKEEMFQLLYFLRSNDMVFEWGQGGSKGVDEEVMVHRLNVRIAWHPRKIEEAEFQNKIIQEEVNRLVRSKYIQEVFYPEWIANVVLILIRVAYLDLECAPY
ncbi:hypothetical protein Salat_2414400 [Sesamum alatum]|uniref:Uncharacterized protein n=1 Tax=Sesamum alatum TaxID=300844 RepID=A0AAE1XXT8_9LAMI|nr:hypothetical protein Salat_2414400 [Sesamum alatum]